jgi:sulfonate transport system substrate-binding protein
MPNARSFMKLAVSAAVLAITFGVGAAQSEPLRVRVGYSSMPAHLIPTFYEAKEALKHEGKSYTVEAVRFDGSTPQLTALAAGEIDMAALSPTALALGVANASLDVKVVADIIQDGVPGYYSQTIYVKANSGINKPEDLKGKVVAVNQVGSAVDMALRAMAAKSGLNPERDMRVIEASFANVLPMLEDGKIDAGAIQQPMASRLVKEGKYKALFSSAEAIGPTEFVFLVARTDFLKKNPDQLKDFFEDHVRGFRWIVDPANRDKALPIIAKASVRPVEQMNYLFSDIDYFRDPYLMPNIEGLQLAIDVAAHLKVIPEAMKVAPDYVDTHFVEEAKRRIEASK